jgi:hypothetical protein
MEEMGRKLARAFAQELLETFRDAGNPAALNGGGSSGGGSSGGSLGGPGSGSSSGALGSEREGRVRDDVDEFQHELPVVLWPSEVLGYLGNDGYISKNALLGRVWQRTHESSYRAALEQWLQRGRRASRTEDPSTIPACRQVPDEFPSVKTAEDFARFKAGASHAVVQRLIVTKGRALEEDTARLLAGTLRQPIQHRNVATYWRSDVSRACSLGGVSRRTLRPPGPITKPGPYVLVGEVDGWLSQPPHENVVVEFKLRMGEVNPTPPLRDVLQIQAYLEMNNVERGLHVQRKFGTDTLVIASIARDREAWATRVIPGLDAFVCQVRALLRGAMEDDQLRHQVLMTCEGGGPAVSLPRPPSAAVDVGGGSGKPACVQVASLPPLPNAGKPCESAEEQGLVAAGGGSSPLRRHRQQRRRVVLEDGCESGDSSQEEKTDKVDCAEGSVDEDENDDGDDAEYEDVEQDGESGDESEFEGTVGVTKKRGRDKPRSEKSGSKKKRAVLEKRPMMRQPLSAPGRIATRSQQAAGADGRQLRSRVRSRSCGRR